MIRRVYVTLLDSEYGNGIPFVPWGSDGVWVVKAVSMTFAVPHLCLLFPSIDAHLLSNIGHTLGTPGGASQ